MTTLQVPVQPEDDGLSFLEKMKDGRDHMYNDSIGLTGDMEVKWSGPANFGVPFLKNVWDVLWYIDGHQDMIGERPSGFKTSQALFQIQWL